MRRRVLIWTGSLVALAALAGLGIYLWRVGLDDADKLASVFGLFVALAGLAVALYGLIADRRAVDVDVDQEAEVGGNGEVYQAGGDINERQAKPSSAPDDPASSASPDGRKQPRVRQRAKTTESGRSYQAGRDINKR
ncbi:hypothetical protein HTZ77_25780 [Nonomuraea sp. SMC257]|uniref:Uncharacterized protein n=1 Tax=Nonomuraea montanisoli TaxID=2741721 RepID=A0A7Y6IAS9_9ACTN|nr:hypothetical protein [Nonomuraea montanisoli]NUW34815.1 hypothetical protein [Nonomuraea montanisoli]